MVIVIIIIFYFVYNVHTYTSFGVSPCCGIFFFFFDFVVVVVVVVGIFIIICIKLTVFQPFQLDRTLLMIQKKLEKSIYRHSSTIQASHTITYQTYNNTYTYKNLSALCKRLICANTIQPVYYRYFFPFIWHEKRILENKIFELKLDSKLLLFLSSPSSILVASSPNCKK